MFIEIILLLLFLAWFVFFVVQAYNIVFRGYAPFVATKSKVIKRIVEELNITDDTVVYELGAGQAGFLRAVRKAHPKVKLVGYEYSFLPLFIAQIQNWLTGSKLILKKKNIMNVRLDKADIIYCYLNTDTMAKLESKFKIECQPGTRIVSYMFPLPNETAEKVLKWDNKPDKVYIYTIG